MSHERALLGSLLIDPEAIGRVRGLVGVDDFAGPKGRAIYAAMLALHDQGEPTDYVLVEAELDRRGDLGKVVRASDVIELALHCPTSVYAEQYARRVREAADKRRAAARPPQGGALAL